MALKYPVFLIAVTVICAGALAGPKKTLPSQPIDLNRATLDQLEQLPGVGPAMARSILKFRRLSGPFERVEDLLALRGISPRRFEKIRPYVFVGTPKNESTPPAPFHGKRASRAAPQG